MESVFGGVILHFAINDGTRYYNTSMIGPGYWERVKVGERVKVEGVAGLVSGRHNTGAHSRV